MSEPEASPTPTLTINGGDPTPVKPGTRLIFALREQGIMLQSACGGRGLCGLCRVKVTKGGGPLAPEETKKLKPEDLASSLRLACRIVITEDIAVEIDRKALEAKILKATVAEKTPLNYDTYRLMLSLDDGKAMAFAAGQYAQLELGPNPANGATVWRAYSLASPPSRGNELEFVVRKAPFGAGSGYIHDHLKVGDKMRLTGPHGDFRLRPTPTPALFLAGGSGISPFMSMLADAAERKLPKEITLIFGGVSKKDIYELEKIAELGSALPNFRFIPALSKPLDDDGWEGETGLITDVALRHFPDMSGIEAYLCGSPGMIGACAECFKKAGLAESKIFFDQFA